MACHDILRTQAKVGDASNGLFWIDPWSVDGQKVAVKIRPYTHDLRMHAERALTLIANARAAYPAPPATDLGVGVTQTGPTIPNFNPANAYPSNPTTLRHPDAIDALELGARRIDFIGLKFQLSDEIVQDYALAQVAQASTDKKLHATVGHDLGQIRAVNGRLEDIRDTYSLLRDLYEQAWLRSNRPYALRPILEHYDYTIGQWQGRIERFRAVQRQYDGTKALPTPFELGLPTQ
jgi:hexosaminidase